MRSLMVNSYFVDSVLWTVIWLLWAYMIRGLIDYYEYHREHPWQR